MNQAKRFQTLKTMVDRNATLYPKKIAMKEVERDKACTFEELRERVNRMGNGLYALGAKRGDRVGILSQNRFEYIESILSVPYAGLIFVPVNFRLAPGEMVSVLADAEPVILIVHEQFIETAKMAKEAIPSLKEFIYIGAAVKKPEGWHDYEELIAKASPADVNADVLEDDVATLMYTSGTTGLPKGVMQTQANLYHCGRTGAFNNRIETDTVGFTVCPMYHVTAYTSFFCTFYKGATNVLFPRWDVELLFKTAQEERINAGMLATPMVRMLLDAYPDLKGYDISSLNKLWFAGAGIIPSVYKQFIDTFGNVLGEHHGTTETTGVTTNLSVRDIAGFLPEGGLKIFESCGRDAYDMEILIVDDDDKVVTRPGIGEMKARGLGVASGYWRKEAETKKAFRDGWFYTEDVCAIDEQGFVYVIDRKKDMIITGGENVYPAEIEKVVNTHPAVRESSAIGVPHQVWGEAIAAVVQLKDGEKAVAEEIIKYCKGKIAGYKVPKLVFFVDEMPRNSSGKIVKQELRKRYASKT